MYHLCACENPLAYPLEKIWYRKIKIERKVALDGNVWHKKKVSTRSDACQQNFLYAMILYVWQNQVDAMWWAKIEINSTFMSIMWTCAAWPLATVASMSQQVNGKKVLLFRNKIQLFIISHCHRSSSRQWWNFSYFQLLLFFCFLFYVKSFVFCVVDKLKSDTALPTACSYTLYPSLSNGYEKKPHLGWRWAASAIVAVGSKKNTQRCRNDSKWKFIVILAAIIPFLASFLRGWWTWLSTCFFSLFVFFCDWK